MAFGHAPLDGWLDGGLKRAQLHEILTENAKDMGAAAGFAAMLGLRSQQGDGPIVWLRTRDAERHGGRFHAAGFAALGGDPATVLLATFPNAVGMLRTAVDVLRCSGPSAVIVECRGNPRAFDLTASRRLTLAAGETGIPVFMLRLGAAAVPTTADTRWSVQAAPSHALEAKAPGYPVLVLTLLRRRGGPAGKSWLAEWDCEQRCFRDAALSGAMVSLPPGRQDTDCEEKRLVAIG